MITTYRTVPKNLMCPDCHKITYIQRKAHRNKPAGHIKTMYCWGCKTTRNLIELK